jgi:hypothetical protein
MHSPTVTYRERLGAPIWLWCVMLILSAALALAFGVPLGLFAGLVCLGVSGGLSVWFLRSSALVIEVDEAELRVGRAHLPWRYIGLIATLDAPSTEAAQGREADARAFAAMRTLVAKEAVTFEVLDDEDPHPYWMISSRDPQALAHHLQQARRVAATANEPNRLPTT